MSQSAKTVTCCIMSYNYGHLVSQAIESVLCQTRKFDKVKVYDDGVFDFYKVPSIYPEAQFIQRSQNMGIVANFNDALNNVDTDLVMFLGADNWLHPETLEKLLTLDEDIISYPAYLVGVGKYKRWEPGVPHGSSLYNVEKAKAVGGYEASGNEHTEEDSVLFKKMRQAGASCALYDKPMLYYRWNHRTNYNKHSEDL